jgi:hypothetical protein
MNDGHAITCSSVGLTMEGATVVECGGTWMATAQIGSIFGQEVEGELRGVGPTREAALAKLAEAQRDLADSLWA